MKKIIAVTAVAVLSFAMLAGCGSKTVDPPVKSPDTTSPTTPPTTSTPPTTAPATTQEKRDAVAKAATDMYVTLAADSLAFEKSRQPLTYAVFDKMFAKSFAAVDLRSFKTKKHAYAVVYLVGSSANATVSKSPKTTVRDLYTIKDTGTINILGARATFKTTALPGLSKYLVEQVTFNKVDGKWLHDGTKYNDAYFKDIGTPMDEFPIK